MIVSMAEVLVALNKASTATDSELALLEMLMPLVESSLKSYIQSTLKRPDVAHVEFLPIGKPDFSREDYLLDDLQKGGDEFVFAGGRAGTEILQLKHTPVIETSLEVREDIGAYAGQAASAFPDSTILTQGTDYWLDIDSENDGYSRTGFLYRTGAWPAEPRSVKVTYFGGWTAADLDSDPAGAIKLAFLETIVNEFWFYTGRKSRSGGGTLISESIGNYSYATDGSIVQDISGFNIPPKAMQRLEPFRNYGRLFA